MSDSDSRLDELYRQHPDGFVAARNELAKELRSTGDTETSAAVKKLRRPSAAAWLINMTALTSPATLREFERVSAELEDAQRRALEGDDDAANEWRAAAVRERDAIAAVVEVAVSAAGDAGQATAQRQLDLVAETLRAASTDSALRERVLGGRLEREQTAATLGTPESVSKSASAASAKRQRAAEARREVEDLREQLTEASEREGRDRERVQEAEDRLKSAKSRHTESKRELSGLKRRLKAAEARAPGS